MNPYPLPDRRDSSRRKDDISLLEMSRRLRILESQHRALLARTSKQLRKLNTTIIDQQAEIVDLRLGRDAVAS